MKNNKYFAEAERCDKELTDFDCAEQMYQKVYNELPKAALGERAYVGLKRVLALSNIEGKNKTASKLLREIEGFLPKGEKGYELLWADWYTYRAKVLAHHDRLLALDLNKKALRIKEQHYDAEHPKMGESYAVFSYIYLFLQEDRKSAEKNLKLEQAVIDKNKECYPLYNQIAFYYKNCKALSKKKEYLKAKAAGNKAIQILNALPTRHGSYLSNAYALLGSVSLLMSDAEGAIIHLERAVSIYPMEKADKSHLGLTYTNLASAYSLNEEFLKATNYYKKAISMYTDQDYLAYGYFKLAEHYLTYPNVEAQEEIMDSIYLCISKTIGLYKKNANIDSSSLVGPYVVLGDFYFLGNAYDAALQNYRKALTYAIPQYSRDETKDRLPSVEKIRQGYLSENILMREAATHLELYLQSHNSAFIHRAIEICYLVDSFYTHVKKEYYDEYSLLHHPYMQQDYGTMIKVLFQSYSDQKDSTLLQEIFDYMERIKGNLLLRNLCNVKNAKVLGVPDSLIEQMNQLNSHIQAYLKRHPHLQSEHPDDSLHVLTDKKEALEELIKMEYPQYYETRYADKFLDIDSVFAKIADGHSLIEYYSTKKDIFALYLHDHKAHVFHIPIDDSLKKSIETHLRTLQKNTKQDFLQYRKNAYFLYRKLMAPLFENGGIPAKLIMVSDGLLANLPFETLLTEESHYPTTNYRDLPYLVKSSALSYAYSVNTLFFAYDNCQLISSPKLLAFSFSDKGNMTLQGESYREYQLFPLPGAVKEVDTICALFPPASSMAFYGPSANKTAFFDNYKGYDFIHMALHAQSDLKSPFNNRIFFYPNKKNTEEKDHYICYAYELNALNPAPRMVVLGACHTGSGKTFSGEGTYSIARSFINIGTPSVLMSLWALSDNASKVISTSYYKNILAGAPLDEALQKAKLSFIEDADEWTAHPSYWASLNLIGSSKAIVEKAHEPDWWEKYWMEILIFFMGLGGVGFWLKKKRG